MDPFTAAIEAFHNAPGNTTDGVRAACAAYLAALPRMQPSDAEVADAIGAFSGDIVSGCVCEFCVRRMRAALSTLPALPTLDAAALRAAGFAECRRMALAILRHPNAGMEPPDGGSPSQTDRVRNCADAIAALKPGGAT